MNEKIDPGSK